MTSNGSQQETALLFLHAQTALHPGSGTALGTVDLPVQRERHTQWPTIPGSTLKGVLRDACREKVRQEQGGDRKEANDDKEIVVVFGPGKVDSDSSHAGAVSLTDARILAFPVRSLKGVFAWVTCPAVLERFMRDAAKLARIPQKATDLPKVEAEHALCANGSPILVDSTKLILEEFEFTRKGDLGELGKLIAHSAIGKDDTLSQERVESHLVVLHDDDFTHFVRHATEVVARIGLNYERKTVNSGALFYQEFLPAETIFYSVVFANGSRGNTTMTASQVLQFVKNVPDVLQIGGDETIGKGLCAVNFVNGKEAAQ